MSGLQPVCLVSPAYKMDRRRLLSPQSSSFSEKSGEGESSMRTQMGSAATEVGLDLKLFATMSAGGFIKEASAAVDGGVAKLEESVRSLLEERKKIEVFKRELPLCMLLLTEVIELLRNELKLYPGERLGKHSFKEFISIRSDREEEGGSGMKLEADCKDKTHWMSSAQLWSPNSTADDKVDDDDKSITDERNGRPDLMEEEKEVDCSESKSYHFAARFLHLKSSKEASKPSTTPCDLSLLSPPAVKGAAFPISSTADEHSDSGSGAKHTDRAPPATGGAHLSLLLQHPPRKTRRCWSPELHRRFVLALQQLGGPQVATPKQIRELMNVDNLTNDEVKSHLQKYRLHIRKMPSASSPGTNKAIVSFRDLWAHPENCCSSTHQSTVCVPQSGSPQSPLQLAISGGAGGDSCEEDDGKSERSFNLRS